LNSLVFGVKQKSSLLVSLVSKDSGKRKNWLVWLARAFNLYIHTVWLLWNKANRVKAKEDSQTKSYLSVAKSLFRNI